MLIRLRNMKYTHFDMFFLNDLLQLVDLKAELYRKQEQFKKDKLGQDSAYTGLKSKIKEKV